MFIICQYFQHSDAARAAELEFCIRDNIKNGHEVVLFEEQTAPEDIRSGAKRCVAYPQRLTFGNAIQWANVNLPQGSIAAIVNLDIMIRFTHATVEAHLREYPRHFLCLSRLEYDPETGTARPNANLEKLFYMNCQDAWVFQTRVPEFPLADFSIGNCPACDNAIAFRAAEAGLIPLNLASTFPIWHYDSVRAKNPHTLMTKDSATELVRPEKNGRLFLPRIAVGGHINHAEMVRLAKVAALELVKSSGYSQASDAKMSNYLACSLGCRLLEAHWDLQYLFGCIAINNVYQLQNKPSTF